MNRGVFVTGTDTDCGKTRVSVALITQLRARGIRVGGFKPVAAGADQCDGELRNDDALALGAASGLNISYTTLNPYCFAPPVAPHVAAAESGVTIELGPIRSACQTLSAACDYLVVEGAGGWRVPLGPGLDIQRLALELGLPVLLVVGLRLGCLNHALLSEQVVLASGARLIGWIGSQVDPGMARQEQNIAALEAGLSSPCLGMLPNPQARPALDRVTPFKLDYLLGDAGQI